MSKRRRVVITGVGPVASIGVGKDAFWSSLVEGRSANETISFEGIGGVAETRLVARVKKLVPKRGLGKQAEKAPEGFDGLDVGKYVHPKTLRRILNLCEGSEADVGGAVYFAVASAKLAVQDAALDLEHEDRSRVGCMVGAATGDMGVVFNAKPAFMVTQYAALGTLTGAVAFDLGLNGVCLPVCGACASGGVNTRLAYSEIVSGNQDVMLAGSSSAVIVHPRPLLDYSQRFPGSPMSTKLEGMKPFDRERSGFVLGEGGGVLVLEELDRARNRGARIYAEMVGYGDYTDTAEHFSDVTEDGYYYAMKQALATSGLSPEDCRASRVLISAHASSTKKNDLVEMSALRRLFGERLKDLMVHAIKGTTGHAQEAASTHELIASALILHQGVIPPTVGLSQPDPEFAGIDFVMDRREAQVDYVIKNGSGFCGPYSSIVFKRFQE